MELNQYGRVVIAFLVGLVLGVGGTLGLGRVNEFITGDNDPMASVSTVSNKLPNLVTPPVVVTRLETATDTKWNIDRFSNGVKVWGGKPLTSAAERIRAKAALPPVADGDVSGVFTNLFDDDSVAENGRPCFHAPRGAGRELSQHLHATDKQPRRAGFGQSGADESGHGPQRGGSASPHPSPRAVEGRGDAVPRAAFTQVRQRPPETLGRFHSRWLEW